MDYMFKIGFLGTKAPFFMDFVLIMVVLLPILAYTAILFAKEKNYKLHALTHQILFVIAFIVVGYFEYGVRKGGGYDEFIKYSTVSHTYSFIVLIIHILIAMIGFGIWLYTIIQAKKNYKNSKLEIEYIQKHKKLGIYSFISIVFTSITGIWVYLILFL